MSNKAKTDTDAAKTPANSQDAIEPEVRLTTSPSLNYIS